MTKAIDAVLSTTREVPDLEYLMKLITSGNFTKVEDMISAFKITTQLPELGQLNNVTKTFNFMNAAFRALPFKQGYFYSKAGVASYRRWNDFSFKMPCSTTGYQTFSFAGITRKVPYPKFYSCDYKDVMHWPNHHIPYIKFRVT